MLTPVRIENERRTGHPAAMLGLPSASQDGQPAVRLVSAHPFARGFTADGTELESDLLVLDCTPGEHEHALAARTDYGVLRSRTLGYLVA